MNIRSCGNVVYSSSTYRQSVTPKAPLKLLNYQEAGGEVREHEEMAIQGFRFHLFKMIQSAMLAQFQVFKISETLDT